MPIDWDFYANRVTLNGRTYRDKNINLTKKKILSGISKSPSYQVIRYNSDDFDSNAIITSTKTSNPNEKNIIALPNEDFSIGDIVDWKDTKWLITDRDFDDTIDVNGKLEHCNYTLNFLNDKNEVKSYPCVVESFSGRTKSNSGFNSIELGDTQLQIKLPYDSDTRVLDRVHLSGVLKGKNQRLLVDYDSPIPKAYEISVADRVTHKGLVILTLSESSDLCNDDNAELMIANYTSRIESILTPDLSQSIISEIKYSGDPVLYLGGNYKKFSPLFKDTQGKILNLTPVWDIEITNNSFMTYIDTIQEAGSIKIKVSNLNMLEMPIKLKLTDTGGNTNTFVMLEVVRIA